MLAKEDRENKLTAENNDAVVRLVNGGALFGKVLVDDPAVGVTVLLQDGTTRSVPKDELQSVQYALREKSTHLRGGFIVGGALLTAAGITGTVVGILLVANNHNGDNYGPVVPLVAGIVAIGAGVPLLIVGCHPVSDEPGEDAAAPRAQRYVGLSPVAYRNGAGLQLSGTL